MKKKTFQVSLELKGEIHQETVDATREMFQFFESCVADWVWAMEHAEWILTVEDWRMLLDTNLEVMRGK